MTSLMTIIVFATISQVIVERIKPLFIGAAATYFQPTYVALAVSVLVTVAFHVDIFSTLGLKIYADPMVSYILTGLIISGGSTVVNDLFKSIQNLKVNSNPATPDNKPQ